MFPSAGKLRAKTGRTMVALSAGRGIASSPTLPGREGFNWEKTQKKVSPSGGDLEGAFLCGKEAYLLT